MNEQVGEVDLLFTKDFLKGVALCMLWFSLSEEGIAFF